METLTGTVVPPYRYGWYYHEAGNFYEFWWAYQRLVSIDGFMVDALPTYAAMEIKASASAKGSAGLLDA